jgi:hypothetical protein
VILYVVAREMKILLHSFEYQILKIYIMIHFSIKGKDKEKSDVIYRMWPNIEPNLQV